MKCSKAQKLLSSRFDGELDTKRLADLAQHVAGCDPCRQFSDRLLSSEQALELLTVSEPSTDFTDRVLTRLPEAAVVRTKQGSYLAASHHKERLSEPPPRRASSANNTS